MSSLSHDDIGILKERFRSIGCKVLDVDEGSFMVVSSSFPMIIHVHPTPTYLQFGAVIYAKPKGWLSAGTGRLHSFLNVANQRARLIKFNCDTTTAAKGAKGWPVFASFQFITGNMGIAYEESALGNLVLLWLQDMAAIKLIEGYYDIEIPCMNNENE